MNKYLVLIAFLIFAQEANAVATPSQNYREESSVSSATSYCMFHQMLLVHDKKEVGESILYNVNSVCLDKERSTRSSECKIEISIEDFAKEYCGAKTVKGIQLKNDFIIIFYEDK